MSSSPCPLVTARFSRALDACGLAWEDDAAHSARYDTERTAELFCCIVNRFRPLFEQALATTPAAATPASGASGESP